MWFDINSLKLNIAKTNFMIFSLTKAGMPHTMEPILIDVKSNSCIYITTLIKGKKLILQLQTLISNLRMK